MTFGLLDTSMMFIAVDVEEYNVPNSQKSYYRATIDVGVNGGLWPAGART
jgi:hypothetical protein